MTDDYTPYTFDRVIRILIGVFTVAGLIWLMNYLSDALIPFMLALLMAYLLNPSVELVQKKITNRPVAVFVTLALVLAGIVVAISLIAPSIGGEIKHMGQLLKALVTDSEISRRAAAQLPTEIWDTIKALAAQENIQELFASGDALGLVKTAAAKVLPGVWGVLKGAASFAMGITGLFVILLYLIFLLMDYHCVRDNWTSLIPPAHREPITTFLADFNTGMSRYFRAQAAVASIVGVLFAVGFGLIGLPLGILLGLFIGLLNMVPYLQLLGILPAVLLGVIHSLETGTGIWAVMGLIAAVFCIVQIIQDAVLVPRIMGKVTGLSPAVILLSLSVWGKLLGMLGLLIALPMTVLLWAYYQRYVTNSK